MIKLTKPIIAHKDADKLKIIWGDYYMMRDEALRLYTIAQLSLKPEYVHFINNLYLNYNWMTKYSPEYHKDTLDKLPKDPELYKQLKEYFSQYRRFGIVIPMPLSPELSKNKPVNELWRKMALLMRKYQNYYNDITNCPSYHIAIYVNSLPFAYELMDLLTNFLLENQDAPARVQQVRKDLAKIIKRLEKLEKRFKLSSNNLKTISL